MKIKNEKSFTRQNFAKQNLDGFTLLEAIVAIFVITTGIVGVLSLVTQTISSSTFSKDKLIAAYLAQEGIEIVRNIRDTNWLEEVAWNDGLGTGIWEGDYDDTQNLTSWIDPGNFLNIDASGFYSYAAGTPTKFKRKITIGSGPIVDSLNVKVEVFWQEKGKIYTVPAQENLYNWR